MNNKKILLVDDEVEICEILADFLTEEGFFCLQAHDAYEALETLKNNPDIDLIISDVCMPKMDGRDFLKNVRQDISTQIPFIFTTAYTDILIEDALDMGADSIFHKPLEFDVFFKEILRILRPMQEIIRPMNPGGFQLNTQNKGWSQGSVGRRGFFMKTDGEPAKIGEIILFEIQIPGMEDKITGKGIVKWTRKNEKDQYPKGMGIEFLEIADDKRDRFFQIMKNQKVSIPQV